MAMTDLSVGWSPDRDYAYWSAGVVPGPLIERRLASGRQLVELVETHAVALRGWNYPHIPKNEPPEGIVWLPDGGIEATTKVWQYHEVWRLHPSGLFTHRWRLREDGTSYRGTIHVVAAIYTVAEIFEFGRRLYRDDETVTQVMFWIRLEGVLGRSVSGDASYGEPFTGRAVRDHATHSVAMPRVDLLPGVLAGSVDAAESLFGQLGLSDIPRAFIEHTVKQFLSGKL